MLCQMCFKPIDSSICLQMCLCQECADWLEDKANRVREEAEDDQNHRRYLGRKVCHNNR